MQSTKFKAKKEKASEVDVLVGANIKAIRKERGVTLVQLAEFLNVSYQQVQKYEKGSNKLSVAMLIQLSDRLTFNIGEFIENIKDNREQ